MKRSLFFYVSVILFCQKSFSQTYVTQVKTLSTKWAYVNIKGEMVIPAVYDKCYEFTDNLATVFNEETGCYNFINIKGQILKPEVGGFIIEDGYYEWGSLLFSDGLIPVYKKKWGYLSNTGKLVIPFKYDQITKFNSGNAIAKYEGKFIILDVTGNEIPINVEEMDECKRFSEGLAPFISKNGKSGYINAKGNIAIAPVFKSVGNFTDSIAWAKTINGKVGFINQHGDWVIKPIFDEAHNFDAQSGLARIKLGNKTAYTDKTGKIINMDTDDYADFYEGMVVGEKKGKYGFLNSKSEWTIPPNFNAVRRFKNGYAAAKKGIKWGVIDKTGAWIIQPTYYDMKDMELVE